MSVCVRMHHAPVMSQKEKHLEATPRGNPRKQLSLFKRFK